MGSEEKIAAMRTLFVTEAATDAFGLFNYLMNKCESPIESLFFGELISRRIAVLPDDDCTRDRVHRLSTLICAKRKYPRIALYCGNMGTVRRTPGRLISADVFLYGQLPIEIDDRSMRLDAALAVDWSVSADDGESATTSRVVWIAIECDGHDFHERTKKQASSDRSRDRLLTAEGWRVIRFTGSELYGNVAGCVDELQRIVASTAEAEAT